jgi:DNA repair exonuclease SbcCD nuclease subunit
MRFVHSADWQIGKVFRQFGAKEEPLRLARYAAIERLGACARAHGAGHVLVAGDVYDSDMPSPVTLRAPIERMRLYPDIQWHLIPGNHDPHRPEGVWDRLLQIGLPAHVHLHLAPEPVALGDDAVLLPAPLLRKSELDDTTAWFDRVATPAGALRIGLAHGAITSFGRAGEANNPIDAARATRAGLDYLALGDWHRTLQVGPKTWYAGTPEPDRSGGQERGTALLVEIAGPGATPSVTPLTTGTYRWLMHEAQLESLEHLADVEQRLRHEPDLPRLILRLQIAGALPLATHAELQRRLADLEAALFHLDVDQTGVLVRPTQADLEAIDFDGVLRRAAERLKTLADDTTETAEQRQRAEDALVELYLRVSAREAEEAA